MIQSPDKPNVISRDTPLETARLFHAQRHPNMIKYQSDWLDWDSAAYVMVEDKTIASEITRWLEACKQKVFESAIDEAGNETKTFKLVPFNPKTSDRDQVNGLLADAFHIPAGEMKPPFFLDGGTGEHAGLDPANLISTQSGLLDITTRTEYPATPQFFTRTALPIKYDADATCPLLWTFLREVLDDEDLVALLRQWFGHLITTDTTIQKLLYLQGVPGSGKSTIGKVLDALVGENNVASHKLRDIATTFDLESMIGKSLLKVSEVNANNRQDLSTAIVTINQITGEDRMHIQRKFKGALDVNLKTHCVLIGNGFPDFGEATAAFARRASVIPFRQMVAEGQRDDTLTAKLLAELPGILNFALDGLDDLRKTRKFKIVAASEDAKRQIVNSGNPVRAFVADKCEMGPFEIDKVDLFAAYHLHCVSTIKAVPKSREVFFKELKEAFPELQNTRPRVEGERENFLAGIRLRIDGPPTTVTKVFWLDCELTEMLGEDAILQDPITREPVEAIEGEFS